MAWISSGDDRLFRICLVLVLWLCGCSDRGHLSIPVETQGVREEAVRFTNKDITLAGTLVLSTGPQRHPAVVLFHGSGPQTRNLFMARWFGAQGVAALAYDKRGMGESGGDFRTVPFMDLCDDGLAAIAYLKSRKEIDARHIGVWGLSQGGWLGPLAASRSADVSWVIAVSGPGVSPGDQMLFYYANELRAEGVPEDDVREADALRRVVWNYGRTGRGYEQAKAEQERDRRKRWYDKVRTQQDNVFEPLETPAEVNRPDNPHARWYQHEMIYDPVPALQALRVPSLFIFGQEDRLVPVDESIAVIRRVLTQSGARDFTIRLLPHDDHGMYLVSGPAQGELDPEYLKIMQTWLQAHVK